MENKLNLPANFESYPEMRKKGGHVMAVGSIAHRYHKTDSKDVDFRTHGAASAVYGNAKR